MTKHMRASREWLLQAVEQFGTADILKDWSGTKDEAIAALKADTRAFIPMCDCEQDSDGKCIPQKAVLR